ncbi:MAG TPA: CusA/CzcA family heavy metal efflux RND transporter [Bryobacteraceae bacterium]|nr:CusA/CzcA family heavy metal efflux RND transporter [Bryobacteraceae bacterium]
MNEPVMLTRIVDWALDNRWLVLSALIALVLTGGYVLANLPIDAFPDLTNNQVVVVTECPSMSSTEVDELVTYPIESALAGMPHVETVRSISKLGLSMITVIFDDSFNQYIARQLIAERLQEVRPRLPRDLQPVLGPMATAFGEVYQYTLESRGKSLMDLKTYQDWTLRYALRSVPGVSEVNAWGGQSKQYAVQLDPIALRQYGVTVHDVIERLAGNNSNFGGGYIEHAEQQYTVRGLGRALGPADLEDTVLLAHDGVPVLIRDVGAVATVPLLRYGATLRDTQEAVSATAIALKGENGREVIDRIKTRLAQVRLPEGYRLRAFYDQSQIIDGTIHTVLHNLLEAGLLVTVVLLVFLGDLRAALIVAIMIPLSILFGFIGMATFGVTANLMSLGAIDFGMIVDGSVVMIENSVHRLEKSADQQFFESIRTASHEVARPILFGVAIIIAVYLPIFTLQGLEGRMFRPMAITVCSALLGSLILALTAVPVLSTYFLARTPKRTTVSQAWYARLTNLRNMYSHSLDRATKHRPICLTLALMLVATAIVSLHFIGTEFMPKLDEGSIVITSRKLPGIALSESIDISKEIARTIRSFPEVSEVVTKLGRPDVATEAMGIYESDSYLQLAPKSSWKCCHDKQELIGKLSEALRKIPGVSYTFTQPMEMRLDETVTGIRGDVAIKVFGDDLKTLESLGKRVLTLISSIPGAAEPQMEVLSGVPELQVDVIRPALARYGLNVSDVQEVIETLVGGQPLSEMLEGQARFPIAVRLPDKLRNDPEVLKGIVLRAPGSELVTLNQVAQIKTVRGPEMISRENARRRVAVQTNVRGTDLGTFVRLAQQKVNGALKLPVGYEIEWGGQFENQARANRRLTVVLPVSISIIFALLFATFRSLRQASLILLNVPFALVGGIGALWVRGLNLNLSASVGFIALFGVAVLNGIVLVSHINFLRNRGMAMQLAIHEGAADRLRPVLITALVASIGFLPMAISTETGAEIQRPLATVVIGGLITSTLLTLYILPLLYPWFDPKPRDADSPRVP